MGVKPRSASPVEAGAHPERRHPRRRRDMFLRGIGVRRSMFYLFLQTGMVFADLLF